MYSYLLEIDAWTGARVQTLYLATHTIATGPADVPANTIYDGRIVEAGSFSRSLISQGRLGRSSDSWGFIELANADGGLDAWLNYGFDGRAFTLKVLDQKGQPVSQAKTLFRGTLAALESGSATDTLRLRIRDRLAELQVPMLTARYAGTSVGAGLGVEGDADLQGQLKPRVWGSVANIAPKLVNKYDLLYQVSSDSVSSILVYDGGAALSNIGDYPVLSSTMAATVSPGQYVTCYALGIFRLGGTPAFAVTADAVEDADDLSAAGIVSRMLESLGYTIPDYIPSLAWLTDFSNAGLGGLWALFEDA